MNTHTKHTNEASDQVRAAIRRSVLPEAVAVGPSAPNPTCRVQLKRPTSRQIADALVRWLATGARG